MLTQHTISNSKNVQKYVVRLRIGKIDTSISFQVGIKQGDGMLPVLSFFMIMAFAESLEKELIKYKLHKLHKLQFR